MQATTDIESEAGNPPLTRRQLWLLVAIAAGVFFAADDQTFVVTVLPSMIDSVGLGTSDFYQASWIINGYLLGYIAALPLMGRVADAYGRTRIYVLALAIFMLGSAFVALSNSLWFMVGARTFQAIGGGAVVPVAMAIVVVMLPPGRRVFGLGVMAAASEAGGLLGPIWGGGLEALIGWRGLFWINLPISAVIAVAVWRLSDDDRRERQIVDYAGGLLLAAALALLTLTLNDDPIEGRPLWQSLLMGAGVAALLAAFVWRESRAPAPMLPLAIFRRPGFALGNIATLLVGGALISVIIAVPLYTNVVLGGSALDGGLNLMRLTVMLPLGALAGGWLAGRYGYRFVTTAGLLSAAAGFLWMTAWDEGMSEFTLTAPLLLAGWGFGLVIAPLGAAVLDSAEESHKATASAVLTATRITGMLIATAVLVSHGLGRFYAKAALVPIDSPEYTEILRDLQVDTFGEVFIGAAIVCLVATIPAMLLPAPPERGLKWSGVWS
jgi:MFS family permease